MSKNPPLESPVLLKPSHHVEGFDCGAEPLNIYLKRFADINNRNDSARTYVSLRDNQVVGYYTIAAGSVEKEKAPERVGHGLARHPVPIILLARLAVDKREKGKSLGGGLLRDALFRVVSAAEIIGGRALLAHAKDEQAKGFYEHYGFEPSPVDSFHMFLLMKDIRKTLGV